MSRYRSPKHRVTTSAIEVIKKRITHSKIAKIRAKLEKKQKHICPICWRNLRRLDSTLDHCFTKETDLLTDEGFIPFDKVEESDSLVAQWDRGSITYCEPSRYIEQEFDGNLIKLSKRSYSSLTTDRHLIPEIDRNNNSIRMTEARNIKGGDRLLPRQYLIPKVGKYREGKGCGLTKNQLRLYAMFQADGCFTTGVRFRFVLKRKIKRILKLLNREGIPYQLHKTDCFQLYIAKKHIPSYFTKVFNIALTTFTYKELRIFLSEVARWDGSKVGSSIQYSCIIKDNVEYIRVASTLAGMRGTQWVAEREGNHSDLYYCTYGEELIGDSNRNIVSERVAYIGKVYCVTVDTGMIVVRHNGNISISGNCHKTGYIRATLCRNCNGLIGKLAGLLARLDVGKIGFDQIMINMGLHHHPDNLKRKWIHPHVETLVEQRNRRTKRAKKLKRNK